MADQQGYAKIPCDAAVKGVSLEEGQLWVEWYRCVDVDYSEYKEGE